MAAAVQPTVDTTSSAVLFVERDGMFWLRGSHLARGKELLHLVTEGNALGFDRATFSVCVNQLVDLRVRVGIVRGNVVHPLAFTRPKKALPRASTPVDVSPYALVGQRELDRLAVSVSRRSGKELALHVERIAAGLSSGGRSNLREVGVLYVYDVGRGVYEVDWELTTIPKIIVDALVLVAHQNGWPLPCQLVPPKPRRRQAPLRPEQPVLPAAAEEIIADPSAYEQLSLPF